MSAFSVNRRRILSLWLPRLPTDRIKRALSRGGGAPDSGRPWAVVVRQNNALQISALNDAAAAIGLAVGLPLANARAICPDIRVFDADETADTKTLGDIADWCDRFTPLVALDPPHGLFLDISGCAHLFGGEQTMLHAVCEALGRQGFIVNAAIAATPACARTLTRARRGCVVTNGGEAAAVSGLPVFALGADDAITHGLRRAGLKTIGDVAARAPHEIAARFGAQFTSLLQQALGQRDAPISPRRPAPDYLMEKRFAEPVATDGVIAAALADLSQMLVAAMERHGKGARQLEASFFRTDGVVRRLGVEAGQPVTRTATIGRLFRERLDALADPLDPGFGFDLIRLSASHVETVVQEQRDLDAHAQNNDEVSMLIDRIAARIGGRRVVIHLPQDTHIPERAVLTASAQRHLDDAARAVWPARVEEEPPLRPLRLFDPPEEIEVMAMFPDGPPAQFKWRKSQHRVMRVEGPERIAMEWWMEPDASSFRSEPSSKSARTRDYFRVEDKEGLRFWLYRQGIYRREVRQFRWFMHGLFA
ncbi:MAG: DNA polymerase Y family protein [Rhizobiales bacterium]|nr:DNA polymerase Y family protein [Hyphomicrobiales bacterium]